MKYTKITDGEKEQAKIVDRLSKLSPKVLERKLSAIEHAIASAKQQSLEQVPVSIFATKLSPAEALVKWLRENNNLRYSEIARILNRDIVSIWITYKNARIKHSAEFKPTQQYVPLSIFRDRSLSILEHLIVFLKDQQGLDFTTIRTLLNKHRNTIATTYRRGKKKMK